MKNTKQNTNFLDRDRELKECLYLNLLSLKLAVKAFRELNDLRIFLVAYNVNLFN